MTSNQKSYLWKVCFSLELISWLVGGIIPCRIIPRNLSPNYLGPVYQHHQHIVCLGDTTPALPPENRQISPGPGQNGIQEIWWRWWRRKQNHFHFHLYIHLSSLGTMTLLEYWPNVCFHPLQEERWGLNVLQRRKKKWSPQSSSNQRAPSHMNQMTRQCDSGHWRGKSTSLMTSPCLLASKIPDSARLFGLTNIHITI